MCDLHLSFENGTIGNVTSTCVANVSNGFSRELVGDNFHLNLNFDYQLRGIYRVSQSNLTELNRGTIDRLNILSKQSKRTVRVLLDQAMLMR